MAQSPTSPRRTHLPHGYLRILGRKNTPGRIERVADVLARDDAPGGARHAFLARVRADPKCLEEYGRAFYSDGALMTPAQAAEDYAQRVRVGPRHRITTEDATICTAFFDFGAINNRTGDQVVLELEEDGGSSVVTVDDSQGKDGERRVLPWDETHDDDSLDDLTLLNAFSEAPLLRTLQRRFLATGNHRIYTYVGDILIAINP
jgi:hypothetical protein